MDPHYKLWNQGQQTLRHALSANDLQNAIALFLDPPTRHNCLHSNEALRIKTKLQRVK